MILGAEGSRRWESWTSVPSVRGPKEIVSEGKFSVHGVVWFSSSGFGSGFVRDRLAVPESNRQRRQTLEVGDA